MKKSAIALTLCALASANASADTVAGFFIGGDIWSVDASGNFGSNNTSATFNFDNDTQGSFYAALEHPLPFIPNLKVRQNQLEINGNTSLTSTLEFGGTTYVQGTNLLTDADLSHTDIILYYEVFDNDIVSLDLGLNVKLLDGDIFVQENSATPTIADTREDFSAPVPTLYGLLQIGLPLTGLGLFGEINALSVDGDSLTDYQVGVEWEFIDTLAVDVALRAGYRNISVDVDDIDDVTADLEFDGGFIGLQAHF